MVNDIKIECNKLTQKDTIVIVTGFGNIIHL